MLTLLHYVPHLIFSGLILLALFAMFSDDGSKRRRQPQKLKQHYTWSDHNPRRG